MGLGCRIKGSWIAGAAAARCSCNLASYPSDGVTVGGAALAGLVDAEPQNATAAATASFA